MWNSIKIVGLSLVLLASCQNKVEPQNALVEYFDMKQFIITEIADLEAQKLSLKKIMQTTQTIDTLVIDQPNWANELQIFSLCNINKPTLYGTYKVDTSAASIHYQSIAKKNKVQSCLITFDEADLKTVKKIDIVKQKENFINRSTETLSYEPKQQYTIEIEQNVISAKGTSFKIFGEIE